MKKQITICADNYAAVTDLAENRTKPLLVADCIEKLIALSEKRQITIMWVAEHSGIQENETADKLVREGARTELIGLKAFLQPSLSWFKYKIRNWTGKRKQMEWRVSGRYGTS